MYKFFKYKQLLLNLIIYLNIVLINIQQTQIHFFLNNLVKDKIIMRKHSKKRSYNTKQNQPIVIEINNLYNI